MKIKILQKTFELQQEQSDCGVACLSSIIKYYGGLYTINNLRELSGTNKQGTTLLGLYQASQKIGFDSEGCQADIQSLIEYGKPLILHVLVEKNLEHYVVCYGYNNEKFIIGDPAKGVQLYSEQELLKIWQSKNCLTLTPNSSFVVAKTIEKHKRKWLKNLIKDDYSLLAISVFLGVIISLLGMVMAIFSQKLIDDILPSKKIEKLIIGLALVSILLISRVFFIYIRQYLLIRQSKDFNNRIISSFYNSLLHLPKSFFDTRKIGELVARLNDTGRIQRVISQIVGNTIIESLVVMSSLVFLYLYSWQVGVITSISLPIVFFIIFRFNSPIIKAQKQVMSAYAQNESNYINTMQGIDTIKNFTKQNFFNTLNKLIYGNFQNKIFSLGKINIKLSLIAGLSSVLFLSVIISYTSILVFNNKMNLGELMAISGIVSSLLPSVTNLALIAIPINEAKIAFNRMYEFVSITHEKIKGKKTPQIESIQINNISFRFIGRKQILKNINININIGEIISIVGESGSGKTTLGYLLQRFYKPEKGNIKLNNTIDIQDINLNEWRNILGVVPQEIHLFNGTVLDNISLIQNTNKDIESIISFCKKMGFSKFIEQLPQSYATIIGEEGINISGGQKQIIAMARALYKSPKILLLDEATSAMDRDTEKFIINKILDLKKEMSVIYISHRLHSLKNISDKIYVLEKGIIKTFGNHDEILKSKNIYSDFWNEIKQ